MVIERNWDLLEIQTLSLSLEDVFVRMVTPEDIDANHEDGGTE